MLRPALALSLATALSAAGPASAQTVDRTVRAGMLTATVEPDPFRIVAGPLQGVAGETLSANGIAPRKVVGESRDGDAYVAELDNGMQLRVAPDADGVIRITTAQPGASSIVAAFEAAPGERFPTRKASITWNSR
jgi:hypothetical protein